MANILLVEDDMTLQEAYSFVLRTGGHTVTSAYNGAEGLEAIGSLTYDTILLDIHMPVMDGLEFLKQYAPLKPANTKIIVFSNMIEPEIEKLAISLGASRCILKSSMTPSAMLLLLAEE